jgi:hypothetical protein
MVDEQEDPLASKLKDRVIFRNIVIAFIILTYCILFLITVFNL